MLRKALIIGSPDSEIPGVYADLENYRAYLKSFPGGAWYDREIVTLESPTKTQVDVQIESLKTVDYSFLVYAGHGSYSQSRRTTMLRINPNTDISENDLKIGALKRTVIFDTCRVLVRDEVALREAMLKSAFVMDGYRDPEVTRRFFERSLEVCYPGMALIYGCQIGESAGESKTRGGRYSSALLESGHAWEQSQYKSNTNLSISEAHEKAAKVVIENSGRSQNPQGEFPRTSPRFPFAVKA